MKVFVKVLIVFLILAGLSGGVVYGYMDYNGAPESWAEEEHLLIETGMTVSSVGRLLESLGVIRSYYFFRVIHEVTGRKNTIPTGSYTLEAGMSTMEIYRKLVQGRQDMIRVTFPEGATLSLIAERLETGGICGANEFLAAARDSSLLDHYLIRADSFEGYLFPDTYQFVFNESPENVIKGMADTFFRKLSEIYVDWDELTPEQLNAKVTMASIVEKEYRLSEEAPLIASVFYNRLDHADFPRLQSCATVVYVITEILGKDHPEKLFYRDLEIESPYNTYLHDGLPPAPISNPGYTALEAAFYPAQTDYYFFVVKDARLGTHNFSSNYADFLNDKDYLNNFRSK